MQIPILIEPVAGNGFRAKCGEPLPLCAEAATPDEAVAQLREQLANRLRNGTRLVAIDVATESNPWLAMAGMFDPADPLVQEWKEAMAEYRQEAENDPNRI
jgi:hypothetical protein